MNQTAYMHVLPLALICVFSLIAAVVLLVVSFNSHDPEPKRFYGMWALPAIFLGVASLGWWIGSAQQPLMPAYQATCDIKEVVYPDGTKVQMFSNAGVNYNVTEMYRKWYDEKEWQIRFVFYCKVYNGVSWSGFGDDFKEGGKFFLERKNGSHSVEMKNATPEKMPE